MSEEEKELTPEERLQWLRARGISVETPEERRAKAIADIMREPDNNNIISEEDQLLNGLSACRVDSQLDTGGEAITGSSSNGKSEAGYSWTQTEEELEMTLRLPDVNIGSKDIEVKFRPRHLRISCRNNLLLDLDLFEAIDADGSTWALDKSSSGDMTKLVLTMEKVEQALWARIKD